MARRVPSYLPARGGRAHHADYRTAVPVEKRPKIPAGLVSNTAGVALCGGRVPPDRRCLNIDIVVLNPLAVARDAFLQTAALPPAPPSCAMAAILRFRHCQAVVRLNSTIRWSAATV